MNEALSESKRPCARFDAQSPSSLVDGLKRYEQIVAETAIGEEPPAVPFANSSREEAMSARATPTPGSGATTANLRCHLELARLHPCDLPSPFVRIDRHTHWGNSFRIGVAGSRPQVIAKYRDWPWHEIEAGAIALEDRAPAP